MTPRLRPGGRRRSPCVRATRPVHPVTPFTRTWPTVTAVPLSGAGPGRGRIRTPRRAYPPSACSITFSSTSSAPSVPPSTGRCCSVRPSRSASRSTSSSATSRGRRPTACRARSSRPRVRADVSVDWPTWSQTSYRSWSIGEPPDELPEVVIEVALRVQRMAEAPDTEKVMAALPVTGPLGDPMDLVRTATTIEQVRTEADGLDGTQRWAAEATYEGSIRFSEQQLEDPATHRAALRRPHPLDRLHAHHAGRPPLHVLAPRGGRRLTRLFPRRAPGAILALALGALLAACGTSAPAAPPPNQGLVLNRPTPQQVALVNQRGQSVSLAGLRGKVVVLAPFLSLCQDECPLVTGAFISLQRDLRAAGQAGKVVFVEATVDPGRDTRRPPGRLPEGVRRRLGPLDRHARPDRRVLEALRCRVPEGRRGAAAQGRLVDRPAAHLRRRAHRRLHPHRPRRTRALRRRHRAEHGGPARSEAEQPPRRWWRARPRPPRDAELDDRPTRSPPSAGSSAPTCLLPAPDAGGAAPSRPRPPGSPHRVCPAVQRLRHLGRDDPVVPADHRYLARPHRCSTPPWGRSSLPAAGTRSTTSYPTRPCTARASTTAACCSGRRSS